jgi:hypothetical protein
MTETVVIIVLVFAAILFVGVAIYWAYVADKKRTEAFADKAADLGLTFMPAGGEALLSRFGGFKLFSTGRARKLKNVIEGDAGDVAITIFDYQYTTGSGKHQQTHNQTVVSLRSALLACPDFRMRPEGFFDKVGSAMGFQDIDFDSHPEFSKLFVLQGSNEEAIRNYFKPTLLEFFETKKGISLEAHRDTMFFYTARTRAKADQIKDLLSDAYEVYGVLTES